MSFDVFGVLLRSRARDRGVLAPGPTVSTDVDFLAGLNSVVAFEFDVNSRGEHVSGRGGASPRYQAVPGLEEVPCRIVWKASGPAIGDAVPGMIRTGRVLLGQSIAADRRFRLKYTDAAFGTVYAYLRGPVRDAHQMGHHWVADIQDRPL